MNPNPQSAPALATAVTDASAFPLVERAAWKDWMVLTKPEITFLVTITAFAGFLLGSPVTIAWGTLAAALVGVVLTSAGGAVLNHVIEWRLDRQMHRTASRPIPAGRIAPHQATWYGLTLVAAGLGLLCPLTNPLTGVLAALTVALYLFAYTPLKRRTSWNTLVGTLPGALPALGGWTAATGSLEPKGWILFAILVFWQVPHFLALAWMYRGDYGRARFRMLPVVAPDGRSTVLHVLLFSGLMVAASLLPVAAGMTGAAYTAGAMASGMWFFGPVSGFARDLSNATARRLLKATIYYIPALVVLIVADRLLGS